MLLLEPINKINVPSTRAVVHEINALPLRAKPLPPAKPAEVSRFFYSIWFWQLTQNNMLPMMLLSIQICNNTERFCPQLVRTIRAAWNCLSLLYRKLKGSIPTENLFIAKNFCAYKSLKKSAGYWAKSWKKYEVLKKSSLPQESFVNSVVKRPHQCSHKSLVI